jgi:cytochrome bd-type quinol oxidase subunit 2
MSRIKRILLTLVAALGLVVPMAAVASAEDVNVNGGLACGANIEFTTGANCDADGTGAGTKVDNLVKNVINILSLVVGIAAVVMIIIGGLRYVTSNGGTEAGTKVDNLVKNVINILSLVVGIAAVVMIIIGGLRYVTSNGDSGQVGNAKNTILYAVVGLVVVALAQVIVRFVVSKATTTATP